jgi:hypothetical protein
MLLIRHNIKNMTEKSVQHQQIRLDQGLDSEDLVIQDLGPRDLGSSFWLFGFFGISIFLQDFLCQSF